MKTDVGLKALRESFQNAIHINPVRISPRVLKVLLQSLAERIRDLMESYEFPDSEHLCVISGGAAV